MNKEWEGKDVVLSVKGSYNEKYTVNETLDMGYFIGKTHFLVRGDLETTLEYMKKGLIVQNQGYMPVQKSLDEIARTMLRIEYSLLELSRQKENPSVELSGNEVIKDPADLVTDKDNVPESMAILRD